MSQEQTEQPAEVTPPATLEELVAQVETRLKWAPLGELLRQLVGRRKDFDRFAARIEQRGDAFASRQEADGAQLSDLVKRFETFRAETSEELNNLRSMLEGDGRTLVAFMERVDRLDELVMAFDRRLQPLEMVRTTLDFLPRDTEPPAAPATETNDASTAGTHDGGTGEPGAPNAT
jgi:ABC-type transporter Mla subunit MlaD